MAKPHSLRVSPQIAPALIRHIANCGWPMTWSKPDHDTFTTFNGTAPSIGKAEAFVDGFQLGIAAAKQELSQAFIEGRLKKGKEDGLTKVWIESKSSDG